MPWPCTEWPAPGTIIRWPCGAVLASRCAHSYGVERSLSPLTSSTGTSGSFPPAGGGFTGSGGQYRHCSAIPLPAAVARSYGPSWAGVSCATALSSAALRPASGASAPPHGAAVSAHSVLACRPWLSCGAV